jgi:hypothetical protein
MRRVAFVVILAVWLASGSAAASSWRLFKSTQFGFSVRFPSTWKVSSSSASFNRQVLFVDRGHSNDSVSVFLLPIHPASSITSTVKRYESYEAGMQNTVYAHLSWVTTSLAGKPARFGVARPPTEGGVPVSDGVYVAQSRSRVYQITLTSYSTRPLSRPSQFPTIYARILSTWRFL